MDGLWMFEKAKQSIRLLGTQRLNAINVIALPLGLCGFTALARSLSSPSQIRVLK